MEREIHGNDIVMNCRGFSILEVVIAAGIMTVVLLAFASMLVSQNRETVAVREKLGILELQSQLTSVLADGTICKFMVTRDTVPVFDSTSLPQTLDPSIQNPEAAFKFTLLTLNSSGDVVGGPPILEIGTLGFPNSQNLAVQSIKLEITSGALNNFLGNWVIELDPTKTIRSMRSLRIPTLLQADISEPNAAQLIDCRHSPVVARVPANDSETAPEPSRSRVFAGALAPGDRCPNCSLENKVDVPTQITCRGVANRFLLNNDQRSIDQRCRELGYSRGVANQTYTRREWCYYCNARTRTWNGSAWNFGRCTEGNVKEATCFDD